MPEPTTPVFRLRPNSKQFAGQDSYTLFVAKGEDRTFENAGNLLLRKAEADALQAKFAATPEAPPADRDLTAEEYNKLMEFLLEWSEQDLTALYLADMVRRKFGASARRKQEKEVEQ